VRILFLSPRQCWPAVSGAKLPEYHFACAPGRRTSLAYGLFSEAGARPVAALRGERNIEVTGTADEVRPYYREAVAAGVPVVSSASGDERPAVSSGRELFIAREEQDWRNRLMSPETQPELPRNMIDAGRTLARARYGREIPGASLYEADRRWLDQAL